MTKTPNINLDLSLALDVTLFAEAVGLAPDPWQVRVLQSRSPRMLLNCSRQSGKTSIVAALSLHRLLFEAGTTCVILTPSLQQSIEVLRRLKELYDRLPNKTECRQESLTKITFANKSRVLSLPSSERGVRGLTCDLLLFDEAASIGDEMFVAAEPFTATRPNARILLLSTPRGRRGHFFKMWTEGGDAWEKISVTADECPRISREYLDQQLREHGRLRYEQEFLCQFHDDDASTFSSDLIKEAFENAEFSIVHI